MVTLCQTFSHLILQQFCKDRIFLFSLWKTDKGSQDHPRSKRQCPDHGTNIYDLPWSPEAYCQSCTSARSTWNKLIQTPNPDLVVRLPEPITWLMMVIFPLALLKLHSPYNLFSGYLVFLWLHCILLPHW